MNTTTLPARQTNTAYLIVVYTEDDCRGESIDYPGDFTGCTTGLGSGGISFQLLALDADGNLTFYDDDNCAPGSEVDSFSPDENQTGRDCKVLTGDHTLSCRRISKSRLEATMRDFIIYFGL